MVKRLTLLVTFALVVGLALPVYAEVQNIKVSGDLLMYGISRNTFDLNKGVEGNKVDDTQNNLQSAVRLRVDADLTENVGTTIQLLNEREWGEEEDEKQSIDDGTETATSASTNEIALDLAYVTLKEFFYSPLTLILGRQNLRYGNGFIIGDPDTNQFAHYDHNSDTAQAIIAAQDLSVRKAFDAVRAILDYNPLVVDLLYAKIDEGRTLGSSSVVENDDISLYGANAAYNFGGKKNLMGELYCFVKDSSSDSGAIVNPIVEKDDEVITIGGKMSLNPIERLYFSGELAGQVGNEEVSSNHRERRAYAYQAIALYNLDMKYSPVLAVQFTHYSGDKDTNGSDDKAYRAWDPMFEDQSTGKIYNALFSATNCNTLDLKASVMPIDDLKVSLEYAHLFLDKEFEEGFTSWNPNDYSSGYTVIAGKNHLGDEIDLVLAYDYTEDVQMGLNVGYFKPGSIFADSNRDPATQVLGSMKVAF